MKTVERLWPAVVFFVAGALLLASVAKAGPRGHGPVYIPPILHQDSQQPDKLLSKAFREAVALRVPVTADWRLTRPDPAVCRKGCVVVRIAGRRAPSPQYVLQLSTFPKGSQRATTQISGPSDTTPALLADTILLKTSFLLRIDLSRKRQPEPVVVASAPVAATARTAAPRRGPPRFSLGLSGAALVGITDHMVSGGIEISAVLRLGGAFHLKTGMGFLGAGQMPDGLSTFDVMPVSVLAGFQWSWRRFQLGVYAGATMLVFWVDFDRSQLDLPGVAGFTGISGGPSGELHFAVRLHRYVSVGLTTRVIYAPVDLSSSISDQNTTARFRVPRGLIQSSLDLVFTF